MKSKRTQRMRRRCRLILAASIAAMIEVFMGAPAGAETYTFSTDGTFTNPLVWNFGAGPTAPVADNVKADSAAIALTAATTTNALWLNNGGSVTGAGTLTLTSGTILATGTGNTISAGIAAPTGTVLAIGGSGDLAINFIGSAFTAVLVKQGSGTLTLAGPNNYTGLTTIASGVVAIGNNVALSFTPVRFLGGEIRATTPLSIADILTLSGTMTVGGSQDLTFNGTVALDSATRTINVTNTATTTITEMISGSTVPGSASSKKVRDSSCSRATITTAKTMAPVV